MEIEKEIEIEIRKSGRNTHRDREGGTQEGAATKARVAVGCRYLDVGLFGFKLLLKHGVRSISILCDVELKEFGKASEIYRHREKVVVLGIVLTDLVGTDMNVPFVS